MNWSKLKFWRRKSPFVEEPTPPLEISRQQEIRLASATDSTPVLGVGRSSLSSARRNRSWFGWLWGRNRRREANRRMVQGELLLQQVRPVRNDFREEPVLAGRRGPAKVLYETPLTPTRRDDQDHAWNRLRNRRPESRVVSGD